MYTPPSSCDLQLSDDPPTRCRQVLTIQRWINFALFMGPLIILIVFAVLVYGIMGAVLAGQLPAIVPGIPMLTFVGLVVAVAALTAAFTIPAAVTSSSLRKLAPVQVPALDRFSVDETDLSWTSQIPTDVLFPVLDAYQTERLTRLALIEGATIVCAVFFFLEGHPIGLITVACLLALNALQFPTTQAMSRWLRDKLERSGSGRLE
jgi:hypothetical protein